jgi:hypothetical protein
VAVRRSSLKYLISLLKDVVFPVLGTTAEFVILVNPGEEHSLVNPTLKLLCNMGGPIMPGISTNGRIRTWNSHFEPLDRKSVTIGRPRHSPFGQVVDNGCSYRIEQSYRGPYSVEGAPCSEHVRRLR